MNKISRLILSAFCLLTFAVNSFASVPLTRIRNFVNDASNNVPITASYMDAELNQLVAGFNTTMVVQATSPSSPFEGETWYNTTLHIIEAYRNNEWVELQVVQYGTVMANPQSGDIWIDNSGGEVVVNIRNKANNGWIVLQQANTGFISGEIIMWSGTIATIPSGFVLCNGSNGTPDLRNLFVVGANADSGGVAKSTITGSALQTGGSTTISQSNLPSYNLTATAYYSNAGSSSGFQGTSGTGSSGTTQNISSGGSGTVYTQPFFALAYIMKT